MFSFLPASPSPFKCDLFLLHPSPGILRGSGKRGDPCWGLGVEREGAEGGQHLAPQGWCGVASAWQNCSACSQIRTHVCLLRCSLERILSREGASVLSPFCRLRIGEGLLFFFFFNVFLGRKRRLDSQGVF